MKRFRARTLLPKCTNDLAVADKNVEEFVKKFAQIVEDGGCISQQVFSVDEAVLFWKGEYEKTRIFDESQAQYSPYIDNCFTVLVGGNAAGVFKLTQLLLIHHRSEHFHGL